MSFNEATSNEYTKKWQENDQIINFRIEIWPKEPPPGVEKAPLKTFTNTQTNTKTCKPRGCPT